MRKEWGTLGVFGMAEVGIFQGYGTFQVTPQNPAATGAAVFADLSDSLSLHRGSGCRRAELSVQLSKYVQPFVLGGAAVAGFVEQRNDGFSGNRAVSQGYYWNVGCAFQMDWFSKSEDFDRYDQYSIRHISHVGL